MTLQPYLYLSDKTDYSAPPNPGAPTGPPTAGGWTVDITEFLSWVDGADVSTGRDDEDADTSPSELSLTLDNVDGQFTPGNLASPYAGLVRTPVWMQFGITDGVTRWDQFTGLVKSWRPSVAGPDFHKATRVQAYDILNQSNRRRPIEPYLVEEIRRDGPLFYYPLTDGTEAESMADLSGNGQPPLQVAAVGLSGTVDLGGGDNPPGSPGTSPLFEPDYTIDPGAPSGKYLTTTLRSPLLTGTGNSWSFEFWMKVTDLGDGTIPGEVGGVAQDGAQAFYGGASMTDGLGTGGQNLLGAYLTSPILRTNADGSESMPGGGTGGLVGQFNCEPSGGSKVQRIGPVFKPGQWYHIVFVFDHTNTDALFMYLNGQYLVQDFDGIHAVPSLTARSWNQLAVGHLPYYGVGLLAGSVAHVAGYQKALTVTQVRDHYRAGKDGFLGETVDTRIKRVLLYGGWGDHSASPTIEESTIPVVTQPPAPASDQLFALAGTEQGIFFIDGSGKPTFYNRSHRYTSPVTLTLDAAEQVENDLDPVLDDQQVLNDVRATNGFGSKARATDTVSVAARGTYAEDVDTISSSVHFPEDIARWIVATHANPGLRIESLTVDVLTQPALAAAALNTRLLDRITVTMPDGFEDTTFVVEGTKQHWGVDEQKITFLVTPNPVFATPYKLGTTGRMELNTSTSRLGF